jgi:tripartite-type tricarboxylate transporter receptor subunit TctC
LLPEVPTIDESGLKGFEDVTWNAILAPAATPRPIIERLHREIVRAVAVPQLRARFLDRAIELAASSSPEEATAYVKSEVAAFAKLAKETGLKAE